MGLGSNLGDCRANLRKALGLIEQNQLGKIKARSHLYLTEPKDGPEQPWFLNAVVEIESELEPLRMMKELLAIEQMLGRNRGSLPKNFPRPIDLDILLIDDMIIQMPELSIPHPRMTERRFVLEPLVEIAEGIIHPERKKSLRNILAELKDNSQVKKLDERV